MDRADVSRLLTSKDPRFTVRTILKVARGLKITPAELVEGVDEIPEKLHEDLRFWLEQFAEGQAAIKERDAAIKERDDLRRALATTLTDVTVRFSAAEQRHADEVTRLRTEVETARQQRDGHADRFRSATGRADALAVETDTLRFQLTDTQTREADLVAQVSSLTEQLAVTKKEKVASGLLGALFGASAGAILGAATAAKQDAETDVDDDD